VAEDTPQGQALKRIKSEGRRITQKLEGAGLPIAFSPVLVEEQEMNPMKPLFGKDQKRYRALLPWTRTDPATAVQKRLHERTRKAHPDVGDGWLGDFLLEITYIGEDGKITLGKEQLRISHAASGKQVLRQLGKSGVPAEASVRAISFEWREGPTSVDFVNPPSAITAVEVRERTALKAPEGLPFALEWVPGQRKGAGDDEVPPLKPPKACRRSPLSITIRWSTSGRATTRRCANCWSPAASPFPLARPTASRSG
jgi:hypothetical protein